MIQEMLLCTPSSVLLLRSSVRFLNQYLISSLLLPLEHPLNLINHHPRAPKQVPHPKRPPSHTHSINKEINQRPINNHKRKENPKTAPLVIRPYIQRSHVLLAGPVGAVLAVFPGLGIEQVSRFGDVGDEVGCVAGAGLAGGRVEVGCFGGGAVDADGGEDGGDDAAEPPGYRVDVVHPVFPEDGVVAVWADDAVEEVDHDEEEGEDL
jgi:hypothetical protein